MIEHEWMVVFLTKMKTVAAVWILSDNTYNSLSFLHTNPNSLLRNIPVIVSIQLSSFYIFLL